MGTGEALKALKLVNWYPHDAPWAHLWTDASKEEISGDFKAIAALGANAVRVIIGAYAFGYPTPRPAMEAKLEWIVATASSHKLKVQITLFDFWQDYTDTATSTAWMRMVIGSYRNDPRLCFVEVKNEIDPGDERVLTWLATMYPATKAAAGSVPVTVSVTSGIGMSEVAQWVGTVRAHATIDFFNIHWYGAMGDTETGIAALKAACGDVPLFIGETGRTSQPVGSQTQADSETAQAEYLSSVVAACRAAALPLPAPWVWQDFSEAGLPFVGEQTSQLHYGVLRLDGSRKPAYEVIKEAFR